MLTELQKRKFTRLFEVDDRKGNGFVDKATYENLVNTLALQIGWTEEDAEYQLLYEKWMSFWKIIYKQGDKDEDDRLSLDEFLDAFDYIINDMESSFEKVLIQVPYYLFQVHDTNQDGVISVEEYKTFLMAINSKLDDQTIDKLFVKIDLDGNRVITKDEFNQFVYQFYYSKDENDPGNYLYGKF